MDYTVYTLGDMTIFVSILNAVAMVFGSSMFNPAKGAGIVVIGLLIGILMMVIPAMTTAKIDPKPFIFVLLIFFSGILPKERLQIEDVYTGQVSAVDNIPLIVALPASIIATISRAVTDNVETAFSSTSGSYLAMSAEGFSNPLKLLLGFREPAKTKRTFPYLSQSITEFIKYCAITDPGFSYKTLSSSPDMLTYLKSLNVSGVMTYWDAAHPLGYGTSCSTGAGKLIKDTQIIKISPSVNSILKTSTAGEIPAGASTGATVNGLTQAYNSVTAGILGNLQTSQSFMVNLIAMTPVQQGIDCVNQPTGPNMSTCMSEVMTRVAMEQMNIDSAAQASIFTKTMIPAMNILLALFYAFSPIILAVALVSGAHGFKIVLGFLLFGAWTQSWMPIAAVLDYMIQMQTQYAISTFRSITLENYMQFYNIISIKLGIASTLMAMTPMISMALLSGSMYALSNVAGGMGAKDYTDEKLAAPSAGTNDSLVKNGALVSGHKPIEAGDTQGRIIGHDAVRNGSYDAFGKVSFSETQDKVKEAAKTNERSAAKAQDEALAADYSRLDDRKQQTEWNQGVNAAVGTGVKKDVAAASSKIFSEEKFKGASQSDREAVQAALGLEFMGNKLGASKALETVTDEGLRARVESGSEFKQNHTEDWQQQARLEFARNAKTQKGTTFAKKQSGTLKNTLQAQEKAGQTLKDAESRKLSVGATQEFQMTDLAAQAEVNYRGQEGATEAIDAEVANLSETEQAKFAEVEKALMIQATRSGINPDTAPGVKTATKLLALKSASANAFMNIAQKANLGGGVVAAGSPETGGLAQGQTRRDDQGNEVPVSFEQGMGRNKEITNYAGVAANKVEDATAGIHAATLPAQSQTGSHGANVGLVQGWMSTAEKDVREATAHQDHLGGPGGATGSINNKKIAAENVDRIAEFVSNGQQAGLLNKDGNIAGFNNLSRAIDQYSKFEDEYPAAAAALSVLPMGRVLTAGKAANEARAAINAKKAAHEAKILEKQDELRNMGKQRTALKESDATHKTSGTKEMLDENAEAQKRAVQELRELHEKKKDLISPDELKNMDKLEGELKAASKPQAVAGVPYVFEKGNDAYEELTSPDEPPTNYAEGEVKYPAGKPGNSRE